MKNIPSEFHDAYEELLDHFSFDISPYISLAEFEENDYLYEEGEHPNILYYFIKGQAKTYEMHKNGKISLVEFIHPNKFVGELELFDSHRTTNPVQVSRQATCLVIDINPIRKEVLSDSRFLHKMCLALSHNILRNMHYHTQVINYPLKNRLASFILMTGKNNIYTEKHTEVSEFLGVSYRHLLYVIAEFCEIGLLTKTNKGYEITDNEALEKLSEELD